MDTGTTVEAQISELNSQLELLRAQVRQAQQLSSLGTAAAMIAHEVNNLLTPILPYAQAALEGNDTELRTRALTVTVSNVQMLIAMSERVLEISAASPQARESVAVRAAAEGALAGLCRDLSKDGIRFSMEADESLAVWADPLQLKQVLFNLFLNAREAMAGTHSGRLNMSASRNGDKVLIEVHNTGETISADMLPYVFDRFLTSKPVERGGRHRCGGLGLALCRDLIEENDGAISVTSSPESGTTFTIELPADTPRG